MLLSTPSSNTNFAINRNFISARQNMQGKATSLYYMDYLFKMKELRAKFNGKIIPNINGETIVKNAIKHLQSFLSSEFPSMTINRSSNSISFQKSIIDSTNNYILFINLLETMTRNAIINSENFTSESQVAPYSAVPIQCGLHLFSSTYLKSAAQYKSDTIAIHFSDNIRIATNTYTYFTDNSYRRLKPGEILCIEINMLKHYFERRYDDYNGYTYAITGRGSDLAQIIVQTPEFIREISEFVQEKADHLLSNDFNPLVKGHDFIRSNAMGISSLINLKNRFNSTCRNNCGNSINNITAALSGNGRRDFDPANLILWIREFHVIFDAMLMDLLNEMTLVNEKSTAMKFQSYPDWFSVYDDIDIEVSVKEVDSLFMIISVINGYLTNMKYHSNPCITDEGIKNILEIVKVNPDNESINIKPIFGTEIYFKTLLDSYKTTLRQFNMAVDEKVQSRQPNPFAA